MNIESIVVGSLGTNCYIIYDKKTKDAIVVDPGDSYDIIHSKLETLKVKVLYVVLTHAHVDHICAIDNLKADYGAKICIGEKDGEKLNNSMLNLCSLFGCSSPTSKADIMLSNNDTLDISDNSIKIIHTPGHTDGSISLYFDDCLISGDTLFFESVGRTDFPSGDSYALRNSIKNILFKLPDETKVYPGHGEMTTIGYEKINNPFIW